MALGTSAASTLGFAGLFHPNPHLSAGSAETGRKAQSSPRALLRAQGLWSPPPPSPQLTHVEQVVGRIQGHVQEHVCGGRLCSPSCVCPLLPALSKLRLGSSTCLRAFASAVPPPAPPPQISAELPAPPLGPTQQKGRQ